MGKATSSGDRLRRLREQAGLSQDELAAEAGLGVAQRRSGPTIGQWERGGAPTLPTAVAVAGALARALDRGRADVLVYLAIGSG